MTAPRKIIDLFSGPKPFNMVLPLVMAYLIAGTIAQKYIGLYEATRIFFSNPVLWIGPFPLPGLPVLLALIAFNLSLKLIFKSPWNKYTAGTITIHIGVLLLLMGGLFTALFSNEGYLDLYEGQEKSFVSDYHSREFVLLDEQGQTLETFNHAALRVGQKLHITEPPIVLEILETCKNCTISLREDATHDHQGMAAKMKLTPGTLKKQDEENLTGLTFSVQGSENDGIYLALDEVPKLPEIKAGGSILKLDLRKTRRDLPFTVRLLSFKRELYPGTEMASAYESRIEIRDGPAHWQTIISMNQPVRYKGYTLFQSSFAQTPAGMISILAVVHNTGRLFPYISGLSIALGLILHLMIRGGMFHKRPKKTALVIAAALCAALFQTDPAYAQPAPDNASTPLPMETWAGLPILHQGRIKPLDSFARATLKKISGQDSLQNLPAINWLAEALFNPSHAENRPIIKILNPELRALLKLPLREKNRYSASEVAKSLAGQKNKLSEILSLPEDEKTATQKDFILLHENLALMNDVMGSMSLFLPLSATLPEDVPNDLKPFAQKTLTYLDTLKLRETLERELKVIVEQKGKDIETYTPAQQAIVFLSFSTSRLRQKGQTSTVLKVIPARRIDETAWLAPWSVTLEGAGTPQSAELFALWKNLALAYQSGEFEKWNETLVELSNKTKTPALQKSERDRLVAEYYYNRLAPFTLSFWLFALSALCLAATRFLPVRLGINLSMVLFATGVLIHLGGLALRIYILQRPPVSTLYESILFVAAVSTVYALIAYIRQKNMLWITVGTSCGLILGLLGFSHDTDADSLLMLTAVLNTNFWLATHVLCISTGYAFSFMAAFLAHWSLIIMMRSKTVTPPAALYKTMQTTALLALLFCATGTILGGIWADQSWGRFWGWDPKENGALLLVLWQIWIIHGRLTGQFSPAIFTAGLAYTLSILAISWFGVNLLSVGLHAYGFTEAAAWLFWSVLCAETLFCIGAIFILKPAQSTKVEPA